MIIPEEEGGHPEGISDEEANRVAREIAEELGLVVGPRSRICHSCGRVIMVKDWQVHQKGHRIHHLRRRGEVKW